MWNSVKGMPLAMAIGPQTAWSSRIDDVALWSLAAKMLFAMTERLISGQEEASHCGENLHLCSSVDDVDYQGGVFSVVLLGLVVEGLLEIDHVVKWSHCCCCCYLRG